MLYAQDCWPNYSRLRRVAGGHVWRLGVTILAYQYKNTPNVSSTREAFSVCTNQVSALFVSKRFQYKEEIEGTMKMDTKGHAITQQEMKLFPIRREHLAAYEGGSAWARVWKMGWLWAGDSDLRGENCELAEKEHPEHVWLCKPGSAPRMKPGWGPEG